jgi:hypothetical protein
MVIGSAIALFLLSSLDTPNCKLHDMAMQHTALTCRSPFATNHMTGHK